MRCCSATAAVVAAAALTACGSDVAHDSQRRPLGITAQVDVPRERLVRLAGALEAASRRELCGATAKLAHRASARSAGDCMRLRRRIEGWRDATARQFGTGGVIHFVAEGGGHRSAVVALDTNGAYRLLFVADAPAPKRRRRTSPGIDSVADAIVDALAARDCRWLVERAHPAIGVGSQPRADACPGIREIGVAEALAEKPDARPESMGTDGNFAFYLVRGNGQRRFTLVLARRGLLRPGDGPYGFAAVVNS